MTERMTQRFLAEIHRRREEGETITSIAGQLGVSRQAVQQWLNRKTTPSRLLLNHAALVWGRNHKQNAENKENHNG